MLKLNYNDCGLLLERVSASLDAIATQRVMLAVYAGETLHMEPGRAAFLVAVDTIGFIQLEDVLQNDAIQAVTLSGVDSEFVEVSLKGTWIASSADAEAGTFITALTPACESLIYQVWQENSRQTVYSC